MPSVNFVIKTPQGHVQANADLTDEEIKLAEDQVKRGHPVNVLGKIAAPQGVILWMKVSEDRA